MTDNISNTHRLPDHDPLLLQATTEPEESQEHRLPHPPQEIADPRQWGRYTRVAFAQISPLYESFAQQLEEDHEMEALVALVDPDQPILVTFFTAVNVLLYGEPGDPLAAFYPSFTSSPCPVGEAYPYFRDFCLRHQKAFQQMLPTMRLQTNEPTRCSNLVPAFESVFRLGHRRPLAMIEIGCSAGLNLRWDQYRYYYLDGDDPQDEQPRVLASFGNPLSPALIRCTLAGDMRPPLPYGITMPPVAQRVGIDLAPLDIEKEEDQRLLRACIWPEEMARHQLLRATISMARKEHPLSIIKGDACEMLPTVLEALPPGVTPCIYHSYALEQGPVQVRDQILALIEEASATRDLYRVSLEINAAQWQSPRLELFAYHSGKLARYTHLADCSVHGEHMRWLTTF
ncbi:DUF2332 domain-containing protein [Ktedonospora formicarum]|uniref:DUF2332 domain-containing protein n=1 Tax=Ktedonospora formicarum TaxID=2778364 RepID=A0A8J3MTU9_9CHLR|nr:DUF2332 domain-containing protein [Ktedonospora formicarum]GHO48567.1 hypothetical protein KSX_67300 [Ktedonospora formicarum]